MMTELFQWTYWQMMHLRTFRLLNMLIFLTHSNCENSSLGRSFTFFWLPKQLKLSLVAFCRFTSVICCNLPVRQVTPVLCRRTSSTKDECSSLTTGSASTPKCLAKTQRYREPVGQGLWHLVWQAASQDYRITKSVFRFSCYRSFGPVSSVIYDERSDCLPTA